VKWLRTARRAWGFGTETSALAFGQGQQLNPPYPAILHEGQRPLWVCSASRIGLLRPRRRHHRGPLKDQAGVREPVARSALVGWRKCDGKNWPWSRAISGIGAELAAMWSAGYDGHFACRRQPASNDVRLHDG